MTPPVMDRAERWAERFPQLAVLDDPVWLEVLAKSRLLRAPAGAMVFRHGDVCENYMLVLEGSVRVQKTAESGREITLYRVEGGQSCTLTTSCLLAGDRYPAEGISETDVTAAVIPVEQFHRVLDASPDFRRFVFSAYGQRISNLIALVEEIAFQRIDARLAHHLLKRMGERNQLECTHQELAVELGTAREVVSRQLKEFERRAWIRLQRGCVEIFNREALRQCIGENSQDNFSFAAPRLSDK